jgi:hypothetical protein
VTLVDRLATIALLAVLEGTLGLACRPTAPVEPPSPPRPPAPTTGDLATGSTGSEPTAPPTAGLPDTCTIEIELMVPSGAAGHGASDQSAAAAKEAAWTEACAQLRTTADLDCKDPERVGVIWQQSSTEASPTRTGAVQMHFEFDVVLGSRRTGQGFGDAPGDRPEACRRAKAHACEQLLGAPCPDAGVRVIAVDGKPPSAAAVEPKPKPPRPPATI